MKKTKLLLLAILMMAVNCAYATTYGNLPENLHDRMISLAGAEDNIVKIEFSANNSATVGNIISTGEFPVYMSYDSGEKKLTISTSANKFRLTSAQELFKNMHNLRSIGNLPSVDTHNVTTYDVASMTYMFSGCSSLESLDLSSFDTQNVTYMSSMFEGCSSLVSLDLSSFNTQNVTNMNSMFEGCSSLVSLDLSSFNTQNVTNMNSMFSGCSSLTSLDLSSFNTQNVLQMRYMFQLCSSLAYLDLSSFNTKSIINMESMFYYCSSLTFLITGPEFVMDYIYLEKRNMFWGTASRSQNCTVICSDAVQTAMSKGTTITLGYFTWKSSIEVQLTDGDVYDNTRTQKGNITDITYTRNFSNTNWNALYVPFEMQYDDWAEDFEIARLNDVHQFDDNEDGVIDRTELESIKLKSGSVIEANTPYMIKAKSAGSKTISLSNANIYKNDENSFDVTSWYTRFTFTGTYHTINNMATMGYYALSNGLLCQAETDAATLGSFRWYLSITDRNGAPAPLRSKVIRLTFDDGEATDIPVVGADNNNADSAVYTIEGVKVNAGMNSLPKGMYISNGKKILVK